MRRGDERTRAPLDLLVVDALLEALLGLRVLGERLTDPLGTDQRLPLLRDGVAEGDVRLPILGRSEAALLVVRDDEPDLVAKTLARERVDELALLGVASLDFLSQGLADLEDRDGEDIGAELCFLLLKQGLDVGAACDGKLCGLSDGDYLLRCCSVDVSTGWIDCSRSASVMRSPLHSTTIF